MTVMWARDVEATGDGGPSNGSRSDDNSAQRLRTRDRVVMMHEALARRRLRRLRRVRGRTLL